MNKSGLVPQKIVGTDGVARTYWIKPDGNDPPADVSSSLVDKKAQRSRKDSPLSRSMSADEINDVLDNMDDDQRNSPEADAYRTALTEHKLKERGAFSRDTDDGDVTAQIAKAIRSGGGTIRADGAIPTCGFCYSPYPERSVAIPIDEIKPADMVKYLRSNADMLKKDNNCVGIWHNKDDDKVYFDISCVTGSAEVARSQCKSNDQIAFFDMNRFEEVTVDKNATSGGAA